jgi:anti-sigma B factor antagonist
MSVGNDEPSHPERVLTVTDRRIEAAVVVTAAGEVDISSAPRLHEALLAAIRRPDTSVVVFDARGLTFLGSRGLAALIRALEETVRRGTSFRVVISPRSPVYRVIEITGVDKEIARYETVEEALRAE